MVLAKCDYNFPDYTFPEVTLVQSNWKQEMKPYAMKFVNVIKTQFRRVFFKHGEN